MIIVVFRHTHRHRISSNVVELQVLECSQFFSKINVTVNCNLLCH